MSTDRRSFLTRFSAGFGAVALTQLLAREAPGRPHVAGKAKAVILLFMQGGPSHLETLAPKAAVEEARRPGAAGKLRRGRAAAAVHEGDRRQADGLAAGL